MTKYCQKSHASKLSKNYSSQIHVSKKNNKNKFSFYSKINSHEFEKFVRTESQRKTIQNKFEEEENQENDNFNLKHNDDVAKFSCELCNTVFTLKKNLNRHYREQHLKANNVCCPYCLKSYLRIKEHLFRCRKGILSKIYAKSEEHKKIYSKLKFKKGKNKIPVISTFITKFSTDSVQFTNRITGITEKYNYTNKLIGEGTFGKVFIGFNASNKIPVAVKVLKSEKAKQKNYKNEIDLLSELKNEKYFPRILHSEFNKDHKIIIETLHGPNLRNLLYFCDGKFPIYTILNIAIELIKRLEALHKNGIVHRDIKPSNIVYGNFTTHEVDEKDSLYLVDYGLSQKYLDDNKNHYQFLINRKFVGTLRYASRHILNTERYSRRDDLESLMYVLVYLFRGELPWQNIPNEYATPEKYEKIRDFICEMNTSDLFKDMPKVFQFIYKNICALEFDEEPPYEFFVTLLEKEKLKITKEKQENNDYKFIWTEKIIKVIGFNNKLRYEKRKYIKEIFHNLDLGNIREYFKNYEKDAI